jgi:phosphoribosylformimino-5-aminoimidazole carboxamide ribotide isomerase
MIIPCIDLQNGKAVQLVRGRKLALTVRDVFGLLDKFKQYSILHVIDLDAAMGRGSNAALVQKLCSRSKLQVRVGGGIRTVAYAKKLLNWGADKVIVASAAFRDGEVDQRFLSRLAGTIGKNRVIIALDTEQGKISLHGWRRRLRFGPAEVMPQLESYCGEFLCTYVDNEGTMRGTNLEFFRDLRKLTAFPITAAGGIRSRREVRVLGSMNMHAAVGMALYTGKLK